MAPLVAGLPDVDAYAPRARVEVNGRALDPVAMGDLLSVSVVLELDALASFSLTVNNWDATQLRFKYTDIDLFDVTHKVHVQLGYADRAVSMVRGTITSLAPSFTDAGPPTIGISGQDSLVLLRDRQPTGNEPRKFVNKTDGEIAELIAQRHHLTPRVDKNTERHPEVYQRDLDDLQFLIERAKGIDFDCYVATDPASGTEELHFERPRDGRDARAGRVYQFQWGKNLISFTPQITIARQVSQVTVRGWDPRTKQVIVGEADVDSLPGQKGQGASGPDLVRTKLGDKHDIVVDAPVQSKREADDLARTLLLTRSYDYVTGTGRCIGQPEMRPDDNVQIRGLGQRFDGEYHITKTTHTFSSSGYVTEFEVRRLHDGGTR